LVSSTTELTGLVPGVGVLLFEADSESDSDSGQEPGLRGTPHPHPWMFGLTVWAVCAVRTNRTLFSQKNKDKSNEVTWGFLNIISSWCSIRFTPAFSTPAIYSCIFHSCIFHPYNFARIAFSTPAFSVAPYALALLRNWYGMVNSIPRRSCGRACRSSGKILLSFNHLYSPVHGRYVENNTTNEKQITYLTKQMSVHNIQFVNDIFFKQFAYRVFRVL